MFYIVAAILLLLVLYYCSKTDPPPINGVYSIPGKWFFLKYRLFYWFLSLRSKGYLAGGTGYGGKSRKRAADIDKVQPLSDHKLAIDATYFNGYNPDGFYFGAGIQRRPQGKVETLLFLRVPNLGVLDWPFAPSTKCDKSEPNQFATNGLKLTVIEPMRKWKVEFEGKLQLRGKSPQQLLKVKFNFDWVANSEYFDFDTDMSPKPTAKAIATEPWSRKYFDNLKLAHQTHTEQFGILSGTLEIEGRPKVENLQLRSMHDHSYGQFRFWGDFHRYILHYFVSDDGVCVALHLVSLAGTTMSHLVTGFVVDKNGNKQAAESCDRHLLELGEDKVPLDKHKFNIVAGGVEYKISCEVVESSLYYCGWDWEAKLHVKFCNVVINGVKGVGMCEWEYRNYDGPKDYENVLTKKN